MNDRLSASSASASDRLDFTSVVAEERAFLLGDTEGEQPLWALCLSGGGIRSAAFAFGVLMGLARQGALGGFHYLSTVSGGGYAGGWLSAWIQRQGLGEVLNQLVHPHIRPGKRKDAPGDHVLAATLDPEPLQYVRGLASYLSPRWGLMSADVWTLLGTYLRNLIIIAVVLVPLLAAVLMLPRLNEAMVEVAMRWLAIPTVGKTASPSPAPGMSPLLSPVNTLWLLFTLAGISLAIAVGTAHRMREHDARVRVTDAEVWGDTAAGDVEITRWFLLPGVLGFLLLNWLLAGLPWRACHAPVAGAEVCPAPSIFAAWGTITTSVGMVMGFLAAHRPPQELSSLWARMRHRMAFLSTWSFYRALSAAIIAGMVGGLGSYGIGRRVIGSAVLPGGVAMTPVLRATFGPLLLLGLGLLATTLFVGLLSRYTTDEDRELWSRAGSWGLVAMAALGIGHAVALLGPAVLSSFVEIGRTAVLGVVAGSGITGLITAAAGLIPNGAARLGAPSQGGRFAKFVDALSVVAAPLFLVQVLILIALANHVLFPIGVYEAVGLTVFRWNFGPFPRAFVMLLWTMVLLIAMNFSGRAVKLNEFSLHDLYKSRLVRTFLGASRLSGSNRRSPSPYTGFDPEDDLPMSALCNLGPGRSDGPRRLFHVINMALNVGRGSALRLQHRKATSFAVSGLHAGYEHEYYRRTGPFPVADTASSTGAEPNPSPKKRAWTRLSEQARNILPHDPAIESRYFARGITLGTAMTISGAAASPNMGYHSSAIITFLLTLLNARLGRWLGNTGPAGDDTYYRREPKMSSRPIIEEAFGLTSPSKPYVYLSDGGHFDNLGLYEMVARRCRWIVVADASADPTYAWTSLARVVQLIRIDFSIPITFCDEGGQQTGGDEQIILPDTPEEIAGVPRRYRLAKIEYSRRYEGADNGWLLILKPTLLEGDPVDVRSFRNRSPRFPHDQTANQWFSEEQFEAYRMLGEHTVCELGKSCEVEDEDTQVPSAAAMMAWFSEIHAKLAPSAHERCSADHCT